MSAARTRTPGSLPTLVSLLIVALGVFAAAALTWRIGGGSSVPATDCGPARAERVRPIDGLSNVENTLFARGSVWAVTSDLPDNFSPGPANAELLRIEPCSGRIDRLLADSTVQPLLAEAGGLVWAKLADRLVAFDDNGSTVATLAWEERGEIVAGADVLWATSFETAAITAIDTLAAEVVRTVDTGAYPVAPITAFGHVWVPSSVDGVVTIIDEATLGRTTTVDVAIVDEQLTDVTAVPNGPSGNEVWVTTIDGELFALSADPERLGARRAVPFEREINRLVAVRDRVVLLPTWGQRVVIAELGTGEVLAELAIGSIPFRVVSDGDHVWVTSDGNQEMLTRIDPHELRVVEQFEVGANSSNTTGPTQPFLVGSDVWVPNRGDDRLVIVSPNPVGPDSS